MEASESKRMTIKIPLELWKKIRRLEESGKVKSIQEAVIKGLEWLSH